MKTFYWLLDQVTNCMQSYKLMKNPDDSRIKTQADIFKALGHPARLSMVLGLGQGPRCVCELQQIIGSDMSTVSKHLSLLRSVGLVEAEKRGKQVFYSLRLPCTLGFVDCLDHAQTAQSHSIHSFNTHGNAPPEERPR